MSTRPGNFDTTGPLFNPKTPEATRAFVKAQYDLWSKVVREIGLQPE